MLDALVEWLEAGRSELVNDGQTASDPDAAREMLADRLEKALATLTRSAVLVE
jgi:hypothetical protein